MTSIPLTAELVGNTPIGLVVLALSLAITAGWLYKIYH
jgi:hypothetical protein